MAVLGHSPAPVPDIVRGGMEQGGRKEGVEMKNLPQVQLNTRVSLQTWTALDEHSKKTGESKASIVDAALREYLEKRKE